MGFTRLVGGLEWKRDARSHEWTAESQVDDGTYVIDESFVHPVELFVCWGRGEDAGDIILGEYPSFERAALAAQEMEDAEMENAKREAAGALNAEETGGEGW